MRKILPIILSILCLLKSNEVYAQELVSRIPQGTFYTVKKFEPKLVKVPRPKPQARKTVSDYDVPIVIGAVVLAIGAFAAGMIQK